MADFKVLLDDLGIETVGATCTRSQVIIVRSWSDVRRYGAVGVVPVSVNSTTSGALKGAAWGIFLAGPLGAAVGSMVGGGMKVAFELHTLEGEVLMCIAGKDAYLDIKKQVETKPAQPPKPKKVKAVRTGPRKVGILLGIAIAILPIPFALFLLRRDHTMRARGIAAAWTVLWLIGFANLPEVEPEAPAPRAEASSGAASSEGDARR